jgi:16S rRNA (cytosine967-C5)-methyltransferase
VNGEALARLVDEGAGLLAALAASVRPGGLLCFSTCSLEPEENEMQIEEFLRDDPRFRPSQASKCRRVLLQRAALLPQRHQTDGAFATRLRRSA